MRIWHYPKRAFERVNRRVFDFGGGDTKELTPDKESWQLNAGKAVSDWALKYLNNYIPGKAYTGTRTAGMAPGEVSGQNWLQTYLNQPNTGPLYDLAKGEITKTLSGGYDPYTSPEYNAMKKGASLEMQDTLDAARRGQASRGTFFQSTGIQEENKIRNKTLNTLDQILAGMSERERERKLNAVPTAINLETYANNQPLQKAQAGMTLGSLPRLIEQADYEAKYQDFVRQQQELSAVPGVAAQNFGTGINYGVKSYETPSAFERIMGTVAPMIGQAAQVAMAAGSGGASLPFSMSSVGGSGGAGAGSYDWLKNYADTSGWGMPSSFSMGYGG